jgi:hypothetical protein
MRRESIIERLPPLQGEGWGGDGLIHEGDRFAGEPIPLPTSPLKGEEQIAR